MAFSDEDIQDNAPGQPRCSWGADKDVVSGSGSHNAKSRRSKQLQQRNNTQLQKIKQSLLLQKAMARPNAPVVVKKHK